MHDDLVALGRRAAGQHGGGQCGVGERDERVGITGGALFARLPVGRGVGMSGTQLPVLSYERYLELAGGRQRVAAALDRQAREAN